MPIYEFACPKCRVIFNFLSKRVRPQRSPRCPKCGNSKMRKEVSGFALLRGGLSAQTPDTDTSAAGPDLDDPRVMKAMAEIERDMPHLDENNPKHLAQLMKKMKAVMPPGSVPKDLDIALRRLEAGESPESIEEDMGDVLGQTLGGGGAGGEPYAHDSELHDY